MSIKGIAYIKEQLLWLMAMVIILCVIPFSSFAQKFYPVHAHVQLLRPYGLHLTDYYSGSRDKFIITLNNRDNEQPFLQARLRIKIKNHGFLLSSREEIVYPLLELNSGIPLRLTSTDITPYLLPQNLNINGRFDNGRLPTGMTEFSVQVVDYYNQRPLSAWHTARAWLDIKKPPMLKLPSKDEQIAFREPTNIRFQWLPRHQGLAQTEYEFVLKELPNNGAAPQSAFAYGIEIFRTRTRFTRLMYNQLMPMLEPNRRYAWQVQAIALDGIDEIGLFENNGFSEIGWFDLSQECPAPTGLKAVPKYARAELSWSPVPQATAYTVAYRPKSSRELFEWTEQQVFDTQTTAYKLKKGWTYEWRVGTLGQSNKPVYSDLHEFTVLENDNELLENCGKVPDKTVVSQEPKLDLSVGDIVTIGGDYPMRVTELQNLGDGWYSGKGKTELTTLVRVQVALQFNRLRVNTNNRQCDGRVEAIYDKEKGHIENADHWDDGGETLKTGSLNIVEHKLDFKFPPMPKMTLNEETGEIQTEGADGKIHVIKLEVPQNGIKSIFPMLITDKDGNTYKLSPDDAKDGTPEGNKENSSKKRKLKVDKIERIGKFDTEGLDKSLGAYVVFSKGEGKYAFDEGKEAWYQSSAKMLDYYQPFAEDYIAPWKLVPVGKQDIVTAKLDKDIAIDQKAVKFTTKEGLTLASKYNAESKSWTVELESTENNRSYEVFALYEGKTIGKLRVVSYLERSQSITLVPINNAKLDVQQIEQELKAIYEPIGIHLTVKLDENLRGNYAWDLDGDKRLNFAGTSFWGKEQDVKLSKEMKELQKHYKASADYKKDEAYLFVLDETKSLDNGIDIQGDMPRKSQFGYIFASNSPNARVIAHEIGHGVFTLQHTFDDEYGNVQSKGNTNNLMDYAEGSHLAAFQWNIAFNKAWLTALDKVGTGELIKEVAKVSENRGITPDERIILNFQAKNKGQIAIAEITKGQYYIQGFYIYDIENPNAIINHYKWNGKTYVSKSSGIIDTADDIEVSINTSEKTQVVRIYDYLGGKCFYRYADVLYKPNSGKPNAENASWITSYLWNASPSCKAEFIAKKILTKDRTNCTQEDVEQDLQRLSHINPKTSAGKVVEIINSCHLLSLKQLSFREIAILLKQITNQTELKEPSELAILRLMNAINGTDYKQFYDLLEDEDNKLIKFFIKEIDDANIYFWTEDHYTSFIGALVWMFKEVPESYLELLKKDSNSKLEDLVFNLNPQPFKSTIEQNNVLIPSNLFRYKGEYNENSGSINVIKQEKIQILARQTLVEDWSGGKKVAENLSPLTPITITYEDNLPLVKTALGEKSPLGNLYVVPAIFLKYKGDKEFNKDLENKGIITLDAITIIASGGTALATKVHWARRLWALAEVAAAATNIGVNVGAITDTTTLNVINAYNTVMLAVGVQHLGKLSYNVAKKRPNASSIKSAFAEPYKKYRTAIDNLRKSERWKGLKPKVRALLNNQEKILDNIVKQLDGVVKTERVFTTVELSLLKRADLSKFVSKNFDDLLSTKNRKVIWDLNSIPGGQFKRGDLIEEIFNQWPNKYKGYQNLNDIIPNYKTLDFDGILSNVNEVVSLKSYKRLDTSLSRLKNTLKKYVKALNNDLDIESIHPGKKRVLDFVIEEGSLSETQMNDVLDYVEELLKEFREVDKIKITTF